jgi:hypothetical protein
MEKGELIERRRDPEDRRAYRIYLLPKARVLRETMQAVGQEIHDVATAGLSEEEVETLRQTLHKIRKNLGGSLLSKITSQRRQMFNNYREFRQMFEKETRTPNFLSKMRNLPILRRAAHGLSVVLDSNVGG